MTIDVDRRDFLKLAGLGGVVFASGLTLPGSRAWAAQDEFYFVQISDTHWGFTGPAINPEAKTTLPRAIAAVNALKVAPDFIVFTGDLTHTTDDDIERRQRMKEFQAFARALRVQNVRYLPGEHDAALDEGAAFKELFGDTHYAFDHKGIHFIALDNVSDPAARIGEAQLQWLADDLKRLDRNQPIVVFAHRPLFDLYPDWDWATTDGPKAIALLMPHANVTVFYGHIHQEHHHLTGHIAHHAAKSLIFPQPAPGSQPKRTPPIAWDPGAPFKGLGFRTVGAEPGRSPGDIDEHSIA